MHTVCETHAFRRAALGAGMSEMKSSNLLAISPRIRMLAM
jgi:hypothetical protein